MLVNILVRTHLRPRAFKRMYQSILDQTYPNIRVIVSYDHVSCRRYIPNSLEKIRVFRKIGVEYHYDNYCNTLKSLVTDGYFFFLDDSDKLSHPNVISDLVGQLKGTEGVICQFKRKERLKPSNELIDSKQIIMGKIGMPCLVLHHKHKDLVDLDGSVPAADFWWIKKVSEKVDLKFIKLALVEAKGRDYGKKE